MLRASLLSFFIISISMHCVNTQHTFHVFEHSQTLIIGCSMGCCKSSSSTHSVSSHHPTLVVSDRDDWGHRACRNNDHLNKTQIPRRFYTIGSHHWPCPYSPIHMGQVFQDGHLLRGWWLTTQVEELWGRLCSPLHSTSSHHPKQALSCKDAHKANHSCRSQSHCKIYMIGSYHQACTYSLRHTQLCVSRSLSSHHPTLYQLGRLSHKANHLRRSHIPRWCYMMRRNRPAYPYNRIHMGQVFQ